MPPRTTGHAGPCSLSTDQVRLKHPEGRPEAVEPPSGAGRFFGNNTCNATSPFIGGGGGAFIGLLAGAALSDRTSIRPRGVEVRCAKCSSLLQRASSSWYHAVPVSCVQHHSCTARRLALQALEAVEGACGSPNTSAPKSLSTDAETRMSNPARRQVGGANEYGF